MSVAANAFEIERRQISWSPLTTLNDETTSLAYDGDPNLVSSSGTDGEQWLYSLPVGHLYKQSNATLWWKTATPNTWIKVAPTIITEYGSTDNNAVIPKTSDFVLIDPGSTSPLTIKLPAPSAAQTGNTYVIKNKSNVSGKTVNLVIDGSGNIDAGTSYSIGPLVSIKVVCDGSNYWIH